jgi:hypothetical protein
MEQYLIHLEKTIIVTSKKVHHNVLLPWATILALDVDASLCGKGFFLLCQVFMTHP